MTYAALKTAMGKQFVVIVELYIDKCTHTYGVAPCTASVPTTGAQKCFNTFSTCQDTANYLLGTKVYRFTTTAINEIQQAGDTPTFPTLRGINTAPTKLTPGKGLGIRSSVSIQLDDHPWTDVGVDPYYRTRTYVPDSQGSFWGKFLARNPFYEGRRIDVLTGYLNDDGSYSSANFERRTYLINKISGPDVDGRVTIEAKDPLKKADTAKAQWPVASKAKLSAVALIGDTVLQVADPDAAITANWALGQTYLRIEDEIVNLVSAPVDDGGGFYTITVSRTDSPSIYDNSLNVQAEHKLGSLVQTCWFFDEQRIDQVLYTLLFDAASIPSSYLPVSTWNTAVLDGGLDAYFLSALITEATGVQVLLDELSQHGIYMWWDERQQLVLIKSVISQPFSDDPFNEDTDIIAGSISVTRDVSNRISQAWMYYGLRFPTLDMKLLVSYSSLEIKVDDDAESANEYDQALAHVSYSRWLPTTKLAVASEITTRLVHAYRDSKIVMAMALDPKDDAAWTGDIVGVVTSLVQDVSGAATQQNYTILEVDEVIADTGISYQYRLQSEVTTGRAGVIAPDCETEQVVFDGEDVVFDGDPVVEESTDNIVEWSAGTDIVWDSDVPIVWEDVECVTFPDYTNATDEQRAHYAFICYDTGFFLDGTQAYQIR